MGDQTLHLNQPMVAKLRRCAADISSNWDGQINIYPPEARELVALIDAATPAETPWSWAPPTEPGPEVRRLRPVERYSGDNGIWYDREPDNSGWRLMMRGRPGEVIEWLRVVAGAGSVYGGRPLFDATGELEPGCGKTSAEVRDEA